MSDLVYVEHETAVGVFDPDRVVAVAEDPRGDGVLIYLDGMGGPLLFPDMTVGDVLRVIYDATGRGHVRHPDLRDRSAATATITALF